MCTTPATLPVVRGIPALVVGRRASHLSLAVERRAALNYCKKGLIFSDNRAHNQLVHRASTHSMKMGNASAVCDTCFKTKENSPSL